MFKPMKRPPLSEKPGALKRDEVQCPICWSILIQPVTMPCRHHLCLTCYQKTVEMASLQCPCCRLRLSVWSRRASKENKLIDHKLWSRIQQEFPKLVETKLCGQDSQALGPLDLISLNEEPLIENIVEPENVFAGSQRNSDGTGSGEFIIPDQPVSKPLAPPPPPVSDPRLRRPRPIQFTPIPTITTTPCPIETPIVSPIELQTPSSSALTALTRAAFKRVLIKQEPCGSMAAATCYEVNIKKEPGSSGRILIENEAQELIEVKLDPEAGLLRRSNRRRPCKSAPEARPETQAVENAPETPVGSNMNNSTQPSVAHARADSGSGVVRNQSSRVPEPDGRKRKKRNPKRTISRSKREELEEAKRIQEQEKLEEASRKLAEKMQKMFDKGQDFPPPRSYSSRSCKKAKR